MISARLHFEDVLAAARRLRASDVHIHAGEPVRFRMDGALMPIDDEEFSQCEIDELLAASSSVRQRRQLRRIGQSDFGLAEEGVGRVRIHAYRSSGNTALAVRIFPERAPDATTIGLPPPMLARLQYARGLVLICGPTGSGKTTALAACLDEINRRRNCHILTIEDPIEYVLRSHLAKITQREVGRDVRSFDEGIYGALRSDPDVIAIGELRDAAAMSAALRAAETGHLVFATVHAAHAAGAVERIIDAFGADAERVRSQIAAVLECVLAISLLPKTGGGRVATTEYLVATDAVRAMIRDDRTFQIATAIATGRASGMYSMEMRTAELVAAGTIAA